ncbi:branched-chain amino acid ABC transporter permease [Cryobacterium ruanii]|uniref:Branched-chain amino acid ABC transporter permease n=1 Tax=Cryobacterium ruanii TaxID=1259197 RepID=A0A4R9APN9_9MICO|nr:branched-chain amino acid ABC transporter permease [Cryobacterium ruanii]TFD67738.1 branched-chain amino acid ABC transporter permease [Cryobacterium ruanii]
MTMNYILQQLVNGLALGSIYALLAIGLTMVYGILRLINFAHGDLMMLGAYVSSIFISATVVPILFAVMIPTLLMAVMGLIVERTAYKPLRGAPEVAMLITSLGVSRLIQNSTVLALSPQPRAFSLPGDLTKTMNVGGIRFTQLDVLTFALVIVLMVLLTLYINRSKTGMAMRASSENLQAARLIGINVNWAIGAAFVLGSALAGTAGFLWASRYGIIDPFMGFLPGVKAFVAAVIGGIGSIRGAVVGGVLLGVAEIGFVGFLPPEFSGYRDAFVFTLLLIVLLVRPNGLFGASEVERA